MTGSRIRSPVFEFEVVGVATGTALVSGALSLVAPYLASLTGALGALSVAGWVARRGTGARTGGQPSLDPREWMAIGCLALGGGAFLFGPPLIATVRGLVLALSLVPLWAVGRNLPRSSS
ncbi:MAG: hypothetical protein ACLPZM_02665 [Thermoplasmata archaeon]